MWDSQAFIAKAKLYGDMASRPGLSPSERGVFLSICIEMAAKAALANEHPALLAAKDQIVSALSPSSNEYSVQAASIKEVMARLAALHLGPKSRLIRDLEKLVNYRNAEIHSSLNSFENIGERNWLPLAVSGVRYLAGLLQMQDDHFLSSALLHLSDEYNDENQAELKKKVDSELQTAKKAWGSLSKEQKAISQRNAGPLPGFDDVKCPVCESSLRVTTESMPFDSSTKRAGQGFEKINAYLLKMVHCSACGLGLNTPQEIQAASLEDTVFEVEIVDLDDLYELGFYEEYGDE